jgi:hypothetical protein
MPRFLDLRGFGFGGYVGEREKTLLFEKMENNGG